MKHSRIHINGYKVGNFHYNDGKEQLEAYDVSGCIIATYEVSKEQWAEISSKSYADCWKELGSLFGDEEDE